MRRTIDAHRSLLDYAYEIFGEPWTIRELGEQGTFKRPAVRVGPTTPAQHGGGRRIIETTQSYSWHVFPEPASTVMLSRVAAGEAEDTLLKGIRVGAGELGRALRIPLWEYAGVGETDVPEERKQTDYIQVVDLDTEIVQSPTDEKLFTVNASMRLRWLQEADVIEGGVELERVDVELDYS